MGKSLLIKKQVFCKNTCFFCYFIFLRYAVPLLLSKFSVPISSGIQVGEILSPFSAALERYSFWVGAIFPARYSYFFLSIFPPCSRAKPVLKLSSTGFAYCLFGSFVEFAPETSAWYPKPHLGFIFAISSVLLAIVSVSGGAAIST